MQNNIVPDDVIICNSLKHIKNKTFLNNSYDPLSKKFVKEIWFYKKTKLGRIKRDLVWIYYRHRGTKSVCSTLKELISNNIIKINIIYFDDCVQHMFEINEDFITKIKDIKKT